MSTNPTALVVSTAMVLDWIGRRTGENVLVEAAAATKAVVDFLLANLDTRTRDMDGPLGIRACGDALAKRIEEA